MPRAPFDSDRSTARVTHTAGPKMHFLALLCLAVVASAKNLPSAWKKCGRTESNLGACLRDAVHVAIVELSDKGAKEFGVFPIDPLFISRVNIEQGHGPVSIELHFDDINIHGLKKSILTEDVKADLDKVHFQAPVHIPDGITLKGHYKVNGKVLVLPIQGDGECELNLANVTAMVNINGKMVKKDGASYGEVTAFGFTFDTTRLKLRLENLFNGNKELSTQMNSFLNENWMEILQELKPAIQDAFGAAFAEITNRIFSKVPYENLFS